MPETASELAAIQTGLMPASQPTLHEYQIQAKEFLKNTPKCGLFLEMGLGKTLITLKALEELYTNERGHILIIAPKAIAKTTWLLEIEKWNIKIPYKSLISNEKGKDLSKKKRLEAYAEAVHNPVRTIYFINRELVDDLVANLPQIDGKSIWAYQTVVIDEYQSFKSSSSKRFKALKRASPAINRLIGLTGTPAPQGIEDLWSEIYLLDSGVRLEKTLTNFRYRYMRPGFTNSKGITVSWVAQPGAETAVYDLIKDVTVSMKNTKLKLPDKTDVFDYIFLDDKERKIYNDFAKTAVMEFEDGSSATAGNAAAIISKLQQMASGTVYTVNDDDQSTGKYAVIHNRKLEMLKYIRDNTDDNLLVAYYFQSDLDMITRFLDKEKIPYAVHSSKDAADIQRRWDANQIPLLLVHPASAGFGLNLQYAGHRLIWYTLSFNLEHYIQMIGRIYRQGQKYPVFVHYLLAEKTVDEKVFNVLQIKHKNQQAMLNALEYSNDTERTLRMQQEEQQALLDALGYVKSLVA